jgi:hypothetical protein
LAERPGSIALVCIKGVLGVRFVGLALLGLCVGQLLAYLDVSLWWNILWVFIAALSFQMAVDGMIDAAAESKR